jgi:hypothetical protein
VAVPRQTGTEANRERQAPIGRRIAGLRLVVVVIGWSPEYYLVEEEWPLPCTRGIAWSRLAPVGLTQ